ncbi:MAG: Fic family protein [Pseudomonadota bacterium]
MRYEDFTATSPGILVPTVFDAKAFVPDALPPHIDLADIALTLGEARGRLGELRGACRRLQNPFIFIRPLQRLEAQTSSAMEGTFTTVQKLALAESGVAENADDDTKEVSNYILALNNAVDSIENEPITHRTLKAAHKTLLGGVGKLRGEDKLPGEFKRDQNMIGGITLDKARFIPPPPKETLDCVSQLEKFINADRGTDLALIDIALAHYQFETIHPFADGNGRVGRMLVSLMAVSKGLLDIPALYVSPELERKKDTYIDKLYRVSAFAEWTEWLNFFFKATADACITSIATIDAIISLQEQYRVRAAEASNSANIQRIIDMLFEVPAVRTKDVVRQIGITDAAARGLLTKLVEIGILKEFDVVYPKAWIASELLNVTSPSRPSSTH